MLKLLTSLRNISWKNLYCPLLPGTSFYLLFHLKQLLFFFFLMKLYVLLQNVQFDMLYGIFQMINSFLLLPVIFFIICFLTCPVSLRYKLKVAHLFNK